MKRSPPLRPFQFSVGGMLSAVTSMAVVIWTAVYVSPVVIPFAAFVVIVLVWGALEQK